VAMIKSEAKLLPVTSHRPALKRRSDCDTWSQSWPLKVLVKTVQYMNRITIWKKG